MQPQEIFTYPPPAQREIKPSVCPIWATWRSVLRPSARTSLILHALHVDPNPKTVTLSGAIITTFGNDIAGTPRLTCGIWGPSSFARCQRANFSVTNASSGSSAVLVHGACSLIVNAGRSVGVGFD